MKPDPQREAALFGAAAQLTGPARVLFLDGACHDDAALRQRLETLLAAHDANDAFLDSGTVRPERAPIQTMKLELPDIPDESVGTTIGRYKLREKVGEGGCGVVYVAEQSEPVRRRVALKVIKLGMDTKQVVARFESERQALAMMDHPNIAKVLDAGTTETGRPFFVMELVRGIRITDYCDQNNLSTGERLNLFISVCHAIQHAHQKGIIHRDIKPSNILVTLHDGVPVPKVIDFGIAKATEGRLTDATVYTQLHQFIGTPAYMSPEQAEMSGLDIDTRSDIYSLGVLLYELLAGSTPFDANELMSQGIDAMRKTIREKEPVRPSTRFATLEGEELTTTAKRRSADKAKLIHQLKGDLDWIVMKCLEKDRTRRYDTANGLAADLKRHLSNEPVVARPPSAAYRFQKAFRRNKLVFTAAAAVTTALVLGIIISTWQAARAIRATRNALAAQAEETKQRQLAEQEARRAEEAKKIADSETIRAQRTAAQADARYFLEARMLPAALAKATEAFKLGGGWEDGLLIDQIAAAARQSWVLSARVPWSEPIATACVGKFNKDACLILAGPGSLRVLDASTGTALGSTHIQQDIRYLFPGSDSNTVVAVSDQAISVFSLPELTVTTNEVLRNRVAYASAKGENLLLLFQNHDVSLLDLHTLSETAVFNWDQNPASKELPFARHACLSADGKLVLLHGGPWNIPVVFWDRRNDPATFFTNQLSMQQFQFADNTHLATWDIPSTSDPGSIELYDLEHAPVRTTFQSVPSDDAKLTLQIQAWSSKEWGYDTSFPILGLVGSSGLVLRGVSGGEFIDESKDFTISDRYSNLLPNEADAPNFLAADLPGGILTLTNRNELLLFRLGGNFWNGRIRDYCATACRDGLLSVNHQFTPTSVRLFFLPFDPRQAPASFSLQWPADSKWVAWAIAATPDASTVAVIAQETDSKSQITAHFGRIRALIYHPGGFNNAPSAWPIAHAFELNAPTENGWSSRFAVITPDARTLLYWSADTTVMRYNLGDGKPLGSLELGQVCAHSRDGRRVAAVSPQGRLRVYDLSSGETLMDVSGQSASGLCLSADGSQVVVAQENLLNTYEVSSGHVVSSVHSSLIPLAYPTRGSRFLAFQPDASGTGGSVVLADTADARVGAVLNRAGAAFTPAFFSDSGDQIAMVRDRYHSEIVRSLRPDEFSAVLNPSAHGSDKIQALDPTNIITVAVDSLPSAAAGSESKTFRANDGPALQSHLGDVVTLQGKVATVSLVRSGNAVNIFFADSGPRTVMVWVPFATYPKLRAILGQDLGAVLNDREIRVSGRLTKYKDGIELTLEDPAKLVIINAAPK